MITHLSLTVTDFKAVPYLASSAIMLTHPEGLNFSKEKPTVIVGPNGAGKSAVLTTLSLQTLSAYIGQSSFDDNYIDSHEARTYWSVQDVSWRREYAFLHGLVCLSDLAPALYYRPGQIPGNHTDINQAIRSGYDSEAREYARQSENKSAGQKNQALLTKVQDMLSGVPKTLLYQYANWRHGIAPKKLERDWHAVHDESQAEFLKKKYGNISPAAIPLILMDEPEVSLDARAEALLWRQIAQADCSKMQIIVATHSWYPLLHPEEFSFIEAVPGYIAEVQAII